MNNCLQVKLQDVVSGDYQVLNQLKFSIKKNATTRVDQESFYGRLLQKSDGNCYINITNGSLKLSNNDEKTLPYYIDKSGTNNYKIVSDVDTPATITISDKDNLVCLGLLSELNEAFDVSSLEYCTELTLLACPDPQVIGNIKILNKLTKIKELSLSYSSVNGSIEELTDLVNLTTLRINNCNNINGELKNLFDSLYTNGKTNGTLSVLPYRTNVKYNEVSTYWQVVATFTSEGWTASAQ